MSFTIEDARFVADTRLKLVQNMRDGRAAEAGISKEELRRALDMIRKDRSIGAATNSKAKGKEPSIPIDLGSFMKNAKS